MIAFLLQLYFGAVLTIAGLSKINNAVGFEASLHMMGITPRSLRQMGRWLIPVYEIGLGGLLIGGAFSLPLAWLNAATFIIFLGVKIRLATQKADDCGCFGETQKKPVDIASLTMSVIWVLLAFLNVVLAQNEGVSSGVRLGALGVYGVYVVYFMVGILRLRRKIAIARNG